MTNNERSACLIAYGQVAIANGVSVKDVYDAEGAGEYEVYHEQLVQVLCQNGIDAASTSKILLDFWCSMRGCLNTRI